MIRQKSNAVLRSEPESDDLWLLIMKSDPDEGGMDRGGVEKVRAATDLAPWELCALIH